MQIDGRAGCFLHAVQSDDVIDVRVRDHDGRDFQSMPLDHFQDSRGIVARIDDDRFAGFGSPTMWQLHCSMPTGRIS